MAKNVRDVRQYIHQKMAQDVLKDKGGEQFRSLSGKDLRILFELYDEYIFGGQIQARLNQIGGSLKFLAQNRLAGTASVCGQTLPLKYYLDVAPSVLNSLAIEYSDRIECLQEILECQTIHLIILLWGLTRNSPIYSSEGALYRKLYTKYFGTRRLSFSPEVLVKLDPEFSKNYRVPVSGKFGIYQYQNNSCYLDSLLVILFLGDSEFYRRGLLDTNLPQIIYSHPKAVTRGTSNITTEKQLRSYALTLQKQLRKDYTRLVDKREIFPCQELRNLILRCYPDLKSRHGWETYNAPAIYDLFTEVFPHLKITPIPTAICVPGKRPQKTQRTLTLFQFWDFLGPQLWVGEKTVWEHLDTPVLVFQNGGLPPVTNFDSIAPEIHDNKKYIKTQVFGETILGGKYRLFGAVVLYGTQPGRDGGSHYVSYIRVKGGQWYYYDDLNPRLERLSILPETVFRETAGFKPEMYFYQKIPSPEIQVTLTDRPGRKTLVVAHDSTGDHVSQIKKLHPREMGDRRTWAWVLSPHEARVLRMQLQNLPEL